MACSRASVNCGLPCASSRAASARDALSTIDPAKELMAVSQPARERCVDQIRCPIDDKGATGCKPEHVVVLSLTRTGTANSIKQGQHRSHLCITSRKHNFQSTPLK